ncbi:hypothetical protein BU24DRAFT_212319 [Aaosphaeria arxii CBS 175.79]|uniref:Uncharacterized protein n=1 Tax=Aaosphaeria arxii CBS 175.79 TaxID=1450172 RepID=A0A6A5XM81_9PLEO|nr:uncharacterized protein BU24DRAFT_212319 [Aaosphaeria arxii CBS 175.79]KAF2014252.1 hypothetical protein BU24DRAFT_212319 [Aaosphaeria arxii CBS 175.79]
MAWFTIRMLHSWASGTLVNAGEAFQFAWWVIVQICRIMVVGFKTQHATRDIYRKYWYIPFPWAALSLALHAFAAHRILSRTDPSISITGTTRNR